MHQDLIKHAGTTVLLALTLAVACGGASFGEDVGVTAATNPVATGEPPGQGVRELKIGLNVVRNERIRTTADGTTQVIFVDKTSLTIGPNSDITIDQYVYNPGANNGNLAVRVGNGVLRFIGGQISHSDQIRITTPTATMGIRGGMVIVKSMHNKTIVVHLYGTTTVTTPFNSVTLSKPGFYVETNGKGISAPIPVPPELLASFNSQLGSKQGQTGGTAPGSVRTGTIGNTGPFVANSPDPGLSPQQLQMMLSLRPESESIGNTGAPNIIANTGAPSSECEDDDCRHDRHHHHHHDRRRDRFVHDHDHDHDYDRHHDRDHDYDRPDQFEHYGWERNDGWDRDRPDHDRDLPDHRDRRDHLTHFDHDGFVRSSFNPFLIGWHNGPCFGPCGLHPGHFGEHHH
jgi:hypothetical protein